MDGTTNILYLPRAKRVEGFLCTYRACVRAYRDVGVRCIAQCFPCNGLV